MTIGGYRRRAQSGGQATDHGIVRCLGEAGVIHAGTYGHHNGRSIASRLLPLHEQCRVAHQHQVGHEVGGPRDKAADRKASQKGEHRGADQNEQHVPAASSGCMDTSGG